MHSTNTMPSYFRRSSILSRLANLPDPGAAFTAVLLVTYVTYLGAKAYRTTPPGDEPAR
jgi:hypothetical protein